MKQKKVEKFVAELISSNTPEQIQFLIIDPEKVLPENIVDNDYLLCPVASGDEDISTVQEIYFKNLQHRNNLLRSYNVRSITAYHIKNQEMIQSGQIEEYEKVPRLYIIIIRGDKDSSNIDRIQISCNTFGRMMDIQCVQFILNES